MDSKSLEVTPTAQQPEVEERIWVASQWQLVRWRFMKHKLAVISTGLLVFAYVVAIFCDFFSPHDPEFVYRSYISAPPQWPHLTHEGRLQWPPVVYGYTRDIDPQSLRRLYTANPEETYPVSLFVRGHSYKVLGLIPTDLHLFGAAEDAPLFLLGTDRMGRDLFSRVLYGARLSLSVGLLGVLISFVLGVFIGGLSGYLGGVVDMASQRAIEFLRSVPTLPLWMGLSAAVPANWPLLRTYFAITVVLSLVGWTGLARVVRSRFLALREEDFVMAARLAGASTFRIVMRHMVPSFTSHLIASLTLSIPSMILGETSLSFLGLGLQPPAISWGVLLKEAQNVRSVALVPWTLTPALFVIVTILAFNFMGDGMRDAADPYS